MALARAYPTCASGYQLMEVIGRGASATVYRALCLPFREIVAVKCIDLDTTNINLDVVALEARTMRLIDHPNLVTAHCSFVVDTFLWVVMPFMAHGSCLHIMQAAFPQGFQEPIIASILKEVLKALDYLHEHGHIHRDVKAGNILVDSGGEVKLCDFGVAAYLFDKGNRQRSRYTVVGTPCWMAPDVLPLGNGYDFKADIWSFGITAIELAHGQAPFSKESPTKVFLAKIKDKSPTLTAERMFSKAFKEITQICLYKDPNKRPNAKQLLKHPFFRNAKSLESFSMKLFMKLPPLWERVKSMKDDIAYKQLEKHSILEDVEEEEEE